MKIQIRTKTISSKKPDIIVRKTNDNSNCKQTSEWTDAVTRFVDSNTYSSLDMIKTGEKIHDIFILPFYTKNGFCDNIGIVCIYGK